MGNEKFVAYYEGRRIASAGKLEELLDMRKVKPFLEKREFLIRYVDLDRAEVIFRGDVGFLKKE
ncbi:MAG: hypothetical protein J7L78_00245 [Dehalococcoidales bacterium]|nr:hypothetical protein [Dehalococcoidales bacterium]